MSVEAVVKKRGRPKRVEPEALTATTEPLSMTTDISRKVRKRKPTESLEQKDEVIVTARTTSKKTSVSRQSEKDASVKAKTSSLPKQAAKKSQPADDSISSNARGSIILKAATAFTHSFEHKTPKTVKEARAAGELNGEKSTSKRIESLKTQTVSGQNSEFDSGLLVSTSQSTPKVDTLPEPSQQEASVVGDPRFIDETKVDHLATSSIADSKAASISVQSQLKTSSTGLEDPNTGNVPEPPSNETAEEVIVSNIESTASVQEVMPASLSSGISSPSLSTSGPNSVPYKPNVQGWKFLIDNKAFDPFSQISSTHFRQFSQVKTQALGAVGASSSSSSSEPPNQTATSFKQNDTVLKATQKPLPTTKPRYRVPTNLDNSIRAAHIPPPPPRPTQLPYNELKKNPEFKALSRKYTGIIVGIPILLSTSYVLYERYKKQQAERGSQGFAFFDLVSTPHTGEQGVNSNQETTGNSSGTSTVTPAASSES